MGRIWTVCSGSGGVGKSTLALSLAVGAAKAGKQTVLLDASGISRSCDLILGMESVVVLDMVDVIGQEADLRAALYRVPQYDHLCFACASLYDSVPFSELSSAMLALHTQCEILVIDLPTGQIDLGEELLRRDDERIIVTRPDDASVRAAERIMLRAARGDAGMRLAINRMNRNAARRGMQYDASTVETILDCQKVACIPEDESIQAAAQKGRAAIECKGPARHALLDMVTTLLGTA